MLGALLLRHFWGVHRGRRPSERTTPVPERESLAVTGRALNRYGAAIRKAAGFSHPVGCHTWRATGITIYLENDGRLEHAQQMGHESSRTTKFYDRTKDKITLSEGERFRL
jgi:integrase